MSHILYQQKEKVAYVWLNRPEVRNAFNPQTMKEITQIYQQIAQNPTIRAVVFSAEGKVFCAGADLNWMQSAKDFLPEQNLSDAREFANFLYFLYSFPKPVVIRVNGPALGGGIGFIATGDIAVASEEAFFSFSEVKLGLVPACICPYIIKKIGEANCRRLFLTGERFSAWQAKEFGLVNEVAKAEELDKVVDTIVQGIIAGAPEAISVCKKLIEDLSRINLEQAKEYTAKLLAEIRTGKEIQEGIKAFLEKKKPYWQT